MNKKDLALNNQQWLICHKIKPNKTTLYQKWGDQENNYVNFIAWVKNIMTDVNVKVYDKNSQYPKHT